MIRALPDGGAEVTTESLVLATSVVDPDVWVRRTAAEPVRQASARLSVWDPADVLLVVKVGDEALQADLTVKARLYAAAGFAVYWVVSRDGVHVHTDPTGLGYRTVRQHRPATGSRSPTAPPAPPSGSATSSQAWPEPATRGCGPPALGWPA